MTTRQSSDEKITVLVEGNIAAGKTTFLERLAEHPTIQIEPEPVASWTNLKGCNLLKSFYNDQQRQGFAFQSYVQLTMLKAHQAIIPRDKTVKVMERSIFSSNYCFVENLYKSQALTKEEYVVLKQWYHWTTAQCNLKPQLIVYLRTNPMIVYERLQKRKRSEEHAITLNYLTNLHDLHEHWLIQRNIDDSNISSAIVKVYDANVDKTQFVDYYKDILQTLNL